MLRVHGGRLSQVNHQDRVKVALETLKFWYERAYDKDLIGPVGKTFNKVGPSKDGFASQLTDSGDNTGVN